MKVRTKKHVLDLPERTVICMITEQPNRVTFRFKFSKIGAFDSDVQLADWFAGIFERYQKSKRPIGFDNDLSPDAALAATLGKPTLAALLIAWGDEVPA
jgi:hypothetical protein